MPFVIDWILDATEEEVKEQEEEVQPFDRPVGRAYEDDEDLSSSVVSPPE